VRRVLSPFAAALVDLKGAFADLRVDWYVFGAQAALVHGAARVTADVDVTVRLGKVTPARLTTALKQHGFELRVKDPAFVRTTRVLPVLHVRTSVPAGPERSLSSRESSPAEGTRGKASRARSRK
jgi:hypothetical protein